MAQTDPVLPRHIAPSPEWVPAPPTPQIEAPFGVRLVDPDTSDTAVIAAWMRLPALVKGWEQDWPDEQWRGHLKAQLDGSYSRPFLLSFRDEPFGYLEVYRAAQDVIGAKCNADPFDLGMHWAVGHPSMFGKGYMVSLVPQLAKSLFAAEPQCRRIMGDPDHRNTANRRLLEHLGLISIGEHQMSPERRIVLYSLPRSHGDVPTSA